MQPEHREMSTDYDVQAGAALTALNNEYQQLLVAMREAEQQVAEVVKHNITVTDEFYDYINRLSASIRQFKQTIDYLDELYSVKLSEDGYVAALVQFPYGAIFYDWLQDIYYANPLSTQELDRFQKRRR